MSPTELRKRIDRIFAYLKDEYQAPQSEKESEATYKVLKNMLLRGRV